MLTLKVVPMDGFDVLVLSEQIKQILNVHAGDTLYLIEAADGALSISSHNPELAQQLADAEAVMREDKEILQALSRNELRRT